MLIAHLHGKHGETSRLRKRGESRAQYRERIHIEVEVEEALCEQAIGEACGI